MTPDDEIELHRLSDLLQQIDGSLEPNSPLREALVKAGLALGLGFIHGWRPEIERIYRMREEPLTEAERTHLRSLGIDPDAQD